MIFPLELQIQVGKVESSKICVRSTGLKTMYFVFTLKIAKHDNYCISEELDLDRHLLNNISVTIVASMSNN